MHSARTCWIIATNPPSSDPKDNTLAFDLGGLTAGSQFDRLSVTGTATLDGTLTITLIDGFVPTTGDSFAVLTAGTRSGTFATITPPDGIVFNPVYSATGLTLVTQPLHVARASAGSPDPGETLTPDAVLPLLQEAMARWAAAGIGGEALDLLPRVEVRVADLPGGFLALASPTLLLIDEDAAGFGWFLDATPDDDTEFVRTPDGQWLADPDGPAAGRIDLLTVLAHELGHVLGLDDADSCEDSCDLMAGVLETGVRRLPRWDPVDLLFATTEVRDGDLAFGDGRARERTKERPH